VLPNDKSQQRILIFLTLLEIMILTIVLILINNNAFAQNIGDALYFRTLEGKTILPSKSDTNAHINVGKHPIGIATNENFIYIANSDSNDVSVISIENHTKIGENIPVGENPTDIAVHSDTSTVYVANSDSDSISVIDGTTNEWMKDIPVGENPTDIAVHSDTSTVYVANSDSDSISVIDGTTNEWMKDIPVGENPTDIAVNSYTSTVYVANSDSDSISVIDGTTNEWMKDIPVGNRPTAIAIDYFTLTVYVANSNSDSISVIDGTTNEWMKDIPVGENPTDIAVGPAVGPFRSPVYVANSDSNDVSVISIENHTKIGENIPVGENPTDIAVHSAIFAIYVANSDSDSISQLSLSPINKKVIKVNIPVGDEPRAIAINEKISTVYVANAGSDGISVIDGVSAQVVAGVKLQINPFNSGNIECNGLISPIQQYYYLYSGTNCIAKPNKGFEFLSWEENLKNNATQLINSSHPASTIFKDIDDLFHNTINYFGIDEILNITKPVEPESILNVNKFGTFTATFNKLPPPLPPEYVATLFGVVVTTLIGSWLTPTIIEWRKAKKHQIRLNDYQNKLKYLYMDNKFDKSDIYNLDVLRDKVISGYTRGDITKEQYDVLLNIISTRYNEIFQNEINVVKNINNNDEKIKLLEEIQSDLNDAYLKKKIDKEHYDLLKEMISELENNKNEQ
jgi:YVTN family beta-propeller protein